MTTKYETRSDFGNFVSNATVTAGMYMYLRYDLTGIRVITCTT